MYYFNLLAGFTRRFSSVSWLFFFLLVLVVLLVVVTRLQLPARLLDFVEIQRTVTDQSIDTNSPVALFDSLLLKNRYQLGRQLLIYTALMQGTRQQKSKPFWMDSCGVKQGDFQRFVQWQRVNPNSFTPESDQPLGWRYKTINGKHRILGRTDVPANGVSYYDASAYCRASDGRLPKLGEYQAATTGTVGNLYPWGNQASSEFWPYLDPLLNATQLCGSQPQAATPGQPIYQLAHGMLEWANLSPGYPQAALMGAGVTDKPHELYALNFMTRTADKTERIKYAGFRCAYDQTADTQSKLSLPSPWGTKRRPVLVSAKHYTSGPPAHSQVIQLLKIAPPSEWPVLLELFAKSDKQAKPVFQISRCEVTRRQYRYFLTDPLVRWGFFGHRLQAKGWDYRPLNWDEQLQEPSLPVVGIDWWSAYAFAQWLGGRLPTLEEWRVTASHAGRHLYPWGNQPDSREQYVTQSKPNKLVAQSCGTHSVDQTAGGINDMAGNVSEWVLDIARLGDGYGVTIAGGNYMLPIEKAIKVNQQSVADPEYRSMALGFRVVRD